MTMRGTGGRIKSNIYVEGDEYYKASVEKKLVASDWTKRLMKCLGFNSAGIVDDTAECGQ